SAEPSIPEGRYKDMIGNFEEQALRIIACWGLPWALDSPFTKPTCSCERQARRRCASRFTPPRSAAGAFTRNILNRYCKTCHRGASKGLVDVLGLTDLRLRGAPNESPDNAWRRDWHLA